MATLTTTEVAYAVKEHTVTEASSVPDPSIPTSLPNSSLHNEPEPAIEELSGLDGMQDNSEYPTGTKLWLLMFSLAAVLVLSSVDMNIVATAVPALTDHFHTVADIGWYSSAFRLCQCAFQFVFGKAYTLFPIKRIFLLANIISIIGSLICGTAATSIMLVVGRAVTGMGSAGLTAGCLVILYQSVPLRKRPMFGGLFGAVEGVSTLSAPLLGGALTQSVGWRWCFYLGALIGVGTFTLTACCLPYAPPKSSEIARMTLNQKLARLDLTSNLLFIPSMTALFLALSWAGTKFAWSSGAVIGPLVAFAILSIAFGCNQVHLGDAAALPLRILKRRSVIAGFVFISCGNSASQVLEYYLPTYFQIVKGYSPARSGYMMLPLIVAATVGALIQGFGTSAIGYYAPFMLFASVIFPIATGLITTFTQGTSLAQLVAYTSLSGLALGIGFAGPQNAVQTILPPDDVPIGTSLMMFAQAFGPAVAIAVAQVLFTNQLTINLSRVMPSLAGAVDSANIGLSEIVSSVPTALATAVIAAIDRSITHTWYLVVGLACATMIGSLAIEWKSVKARRD